MVVAMIVAVKVVEMAEGARVAAAWAVAATAAGVARVAAAWVVVAAWAVGRMAAVARATWTVAVAQLAAEMAECLVA